jgi:hypothetical protein
MLGGFVMLQNFLSFTHSVISRLVLRRHHPLKVGNESACLEQQA